MEQKRKVSQSMTNKAVSSGHCTQRCVSSAIKKDSGDYSVRKSVEKFCKGHAKAKGSAGKDYKTNSRLNEHGRIVETESNGEAPGGNR